jgi:hypothetical protein
MYVFSFAAVGGWLIVVHLDRRFFDIHRVVEDLRVVLRRAVILPGALVNLNFVEMS